MLPSWLMRICNCSPTHPRTPRRQQERKLSFMSADFHTLSACSSSQQRQLIYSTKTDMRSRWLAIESIRVIWLGSHSCLLRPLLVMLRAVTSICSHSVFESPEFRRFNTQRICRPPVIGDWGSGQTSPHLLTWGVLRTIRMCLANIIIIIIIIIMRFISDKSPLQHHKVKKKHETMTKNHIQTHPLSHTHQI